MVDRFLVSPFLMSLNTQMVSTSSSVNFGEALLLCR